MLASGLGFEWNVYAWAVPALLGALLVCLVPRPPTAPAAATATRVLSRAPGGAPQ